MTLRPRTVAVLAAVVMACAMLVAPTRTATASPIVAKDFSKPAIVILGYGLKPDGTMRTILHTRVLTGLAVARICPEAPVIVTGGNPRNGNTEAGQDGASQHPAEAGSPAVRLGARSRDATLEFQRVGGGGAQGFHQVMIMEAPKAAGLCDPKSLSMFQLFFPPLQPCRNCPKSR